MVDNCLEGKRGGGGQLGEGRKREGGGGLTTWPPAVDGECCDGCQLNHGEVTRPHLPAATCLEMAKPIPLRHHHVPIVSTPRFKSV